MEQDNPYAAPGVDLTQADTSPGSPVKAVLYAFLLDFVGSNLLALILGIAYGALLTLGGMPPDQLEAHMGSLAWYSPYMLIVTILGTMISVLAGFVCARIAKRHEYRCALIAATLTCGLMVWMSWPRFTTTTLCLTLLGYAASLLGAHWGRRANRKARAG
ncbi:hypothetical protein GCM10007860_34860 [Chitiniphilus shinanonensis]|uniref:Uncharacterized protein n=1 Tax=Chitiniphilus shinanonensis TaxID=553088 RepID=A0ABQ6BWH1_9NEIS|nr:hypothetical protein [Chitiniphilus shinanonensis]GLS06308.1 hypothetical protein GCM10007860_34860 [Chitiniphilus shinanonensis]